MSDKEMESILTAISELHSRIDKYEKQMQYQQETVLDLQLDIRKLYRRSEGWPIDNWNDDKFKEGYIDNDCTG